MQPTRQISSFKRLGETNQTKQCQRLTPRLLRIVMQPSTRVLNSPSDVLSFIFYLHHKSEQDMPLHY